MNPFCNPLPGSSIWHCDFTVNGTAYSMAWDNSYSQNALGQLNYCAANFPNNPYVCGNTTYTVSPQFTYWEDLSGTIRSLN